MRKLIFTDDILDAAEKHLGLTAGTFVDWVVEGLIPMVHRIRLAEAIARDVEFRKSLKAREARQLGKRAAEIRGHARRLKVRQQRQKSEFLGRRTL